MIKSNEKMSKLFSNDGVVSRNLNFEKMDTESYTAKYEGIWFLWGIFKEYLKQTIITEC